MIDHLTGKAARSMIVALAAVLMSMATASPAAANTPTFNTNIAPAAPFLARAILSGASSYWMVTSTGKVCRVGKAGNYGRVPSRYRTLGILGTSDGKGYWIVANVKSGKRWVRREFAFGDARGHGFIAKKLVKWSWGRLSTCSGKIVGAAVANLKTSATTTTKTSGPTLQYYNSSNWSGYAEAAATPYTSVSGTFNVPTMASDYEVSSPTFNPSFESSDPELSEWVGIDGWSNDTLIQAGVEATIHGYFLWWEVLPDFPMEQGCITTKPVHAGDSVNVNIAKDTSDSSWTINVLDTTTGASCYENYDYKGVGATAEWIAEAPASVSFVNYTTPVLTILPLAPYVTPIAFTNLKSSATATVLAWIDMVQNGSAVSRPSSFANDSFTTTYSGPYS